MRESLEVAVKRYLEAVNSKLPRKIELERLRKLEEVLGQVEASRYYAQAAE